MLGKIWKRKKLVPVFPTPLVNSIQHRAGSQLVALEENLDCNAVNIPDKSSIRTFTGSAWDKLVQHMTGSAFERSVKTQT